MKNQLIQLYLLVCQIYDSQSCLKYQRASNFKPRFTDQELMTVYLFGHLNGLFQKKAIYRFTRHYWVEWFPDLPSYQAFNRRLNLLEQAFHSIAALLLDTLADGQSAEFDHLVDSMPVMLASGSFSRRARVARDVANRGYCAAKWLHFHGVRLHFIASRRVGRLPLPKNIWLREASVHDLTSVKERQIYLPNSTLFGDKAFCDTALKLEFKQQNTLLLTPKKKPRGKELSSFEKHHNRLISRI
ncbi:MAG: transposase, partial [Pyrinomonadaceae bacterium]